MPITWLDFRIVADTFEQDDRGRGRASVTYNVKADQFITGDQALSATLTTGGVTQSIPKWWTGYSTGAWRVRCRSRRPERVNSSPNVFNVHCEFEGPMDDTDLLALPARIKRVRESIEEEYLWDKSGTPKMVANSAGEAFDRNPTRLIKRRTYEIRKFVNRTKRNAMEALLNTVNSGSVTIDGVSYDAGTCYMDDVDFDQDESETTGGITVVGQVFDLMLRVKTNLDTWIDDPADAGFSQLVSGKRKAIVDADGMPVAKPWPLNSDGTAKTTANLADYDSLEFRPYTWVSWTGVPLT